MKVLVLEAPHSVHIDEIPTPEPGPNQVLIRVRASSICGTDVNIYTGRFPWPLPTRFGHEYAGEVAAVGRGVQDFKPGDRVVGENLIGCGHCEDCKAGQYNLCAFAPQLFDTHAEYTVAPTRSLHKLGASLEWDAAALVEPLAVAYNATARADVRAGGTVAILGDGGIGLACLLMARARGAGKIVLTGHKSHRLAIGRGLGASVTVDAASDPVASVLDATGGRGVDSTIVTVGWSTMIRDATKLTRKGGSICVLGLYHGAEPAVIDPMDFIVREQTIRGNYGSPGVWPDVIAMVQAGSVDPRPLITHRFPLASAKEAFEATVDDRQKSIRIVLNP